MHQLFATKFLRTFAFGAMSVVLAMWLSRQGMSTGEVGALLTATLVVDAAITVGLARVMHLVGSRSLLILSAVAMAVCAAMLFFSHAKWVMMLAVVFGIVSPSGYEGGAFGAVEQTLISERLHHEKLTEALSRYNLFGLAGAGIGAFCAGYALSTLGSDLGTHAVFVAYMALSLAMIPFYCLLAEGKRTLGAPRRQRVEPAVKTEGHGDLFAMSALQGLDAFAGGLVVQSLLIFWFVSHFHCSPEYIGGVIFWTNICAAISFIYAPTLANRLGLLNAMVFTHLPCSLSLCLLPFMPNAAWAGGLLIARSFFSCIDVPVRQALLMQLVQPNDRAFATSVVTGTRTLTQSIGPSVAGLALTSPIAAAPFVVAGVLKSLYDIGLFMRFRTRGVLPPTEKAVRLETPVECKRT